MPDDDRVSLRNSTQTISKAPGDLFAAAQENRHDTRLKMIGLMICSSPFSQFWVILISHHFDNMMFRATLPDSIPCSISQDQSQQRHGTPPTPHQKFMAQEDEALRMAVSALGQDDWTNVAKRLHGRTPRQCRERWTHYLSPSLRRDEWSVGEDRLLTAKYLELGGRWILMVPYFPNRTDTMLKNRFQMLMRMEARKNRPMNPKPKVIRQPRQAKLVENINPWDPILSTDWFDEGMFAVRDGIDDLATSYEADLFW
jgi:hypothetical protein